MAQQIPVDDSAVIRAAAEGPVNPVADDIAYRRLAMVNVVFVGEPGGWVLIDAGLPGTAGFIRAAAEARFGGEPPRCILMTHGHFDHVGALETLADAWDVPIYAHREEAPFLDGRLSYAPPDPTVGGGVMSLTAPLYPRGPIDVSRRLRLLPGDGSVPELTGWRWLHTPGHAPGHVSLWREADRSLVVGDAFIATAQESAYAVATQAPELHGPPMYFTPDWEAAAASVRKLAALEPERAVTGHGRALAGPEMRRALHALADNFERVAVPR